MSSGDHLLTLINDVLEMAKIEAGRHWLSPVAFDLPQVLVQIASMFRGRVEASAVAFRLELAEGLDRQIVADRDRLSRMVINLVANAVRFTRAGHVVLRAETVEAEAGRHELIVTVDDTGPGIAAADLERIFQPFEQADGERPSGGTGLGLTLTRQYAELMGGNVAVESVVGAGSRFRLTVPVEIVAAVAAGAPRQDGRIVGLEPGQPAFRLLVVDDEPANRDLFKALLSPLGFTLTTVDTGEDALALAEDWQPDLVFMDLRMPGMDGVEATRRLKGLPSTSGTPVVAVTAGAFEEERREALQAGADEFLRKPFRRDEVLAVLGRLLSIRWRYSGESPAAQPPAARSVGQ
jgi:CheY-like chemotaxis protein/anti-sigma regulatory factor (Ser/Thr protein kinase)